MKIIFFGNSNFSVASLEVLIKNFEILSVVTAPDTNIGRGMKQERMNPVKTIARSFNIPVLQPKKIKTNPLFIEELQKLNPDLQVIVSYGKILPVEIIEIPKFHTINLHASLLPKLRGPSPIQHALLQNLDQTGSTVQYISAGMDEGDIIAQSILDIAPEDDYFSLEEKLAKDGAELLSKAIFKIQSHNDVRQTQNHNEATYTNLITKDDGAIFFSMHAEEIMHAFRAFKMYPGIYFPSQNGNIKILDCSIFSEKTTEKIGEISEILPEGLVVSCKQGSLLLKTIQAPNRRPLNAKDFANGHGLKEKSMLQ